MLTINLVDLLAATVSRGGSDLHLTADAPAMIRLHGSLTSLSTASLSPEDCRDLILGGLSESQRSRLEQNWELDFALNIDGVGRFRGNAHYCRGALEAVYRHIPETIPDLDTLGHRPIVRQLCELRSGLILVTGTTGCGKSTTLAAMVKLISESIAGVIIAVQDPVEYVFTNALSVVKQREVGSDTHSFADAVRYALRQDPDVILVGELRDPETIAAAITAAETGHLVLGTLHTIDAPKAIDRIIDVFPPAQQPQIIAQLANALAAIISQRLLPLESGPGRVLASEVMIANTAVRSCIREHRWEQLVGLLEIGGREGMHTYDDCLSDLYLNRQISKEEAMANARDRVRMEGLHREAEKKGFFSR